jgi:hypothetical protein
MVKVKAKAGAKVKVKAQAGAETGAQAQVVVMVRAGNEVEAKEHVFFVVQRCVSCYVQPHHSKGGGS